jgi:hypothetical protein
MTKDADKSVAPQLNREYSIDQLQHIIEFYLACLEAEDCRWLEIPLARAADRSSRHGVIRNHCCISPQSAVSVADGQNVQLDRALQDKENVKLHARNGSCLEFGAPVQERRSAATG